MLSTGSRVISQVPLVRDKAGPNRCNTFGLLSHFRLFCMVSWCGHTLELERCEKLNENNQFTPYEMHSGHASDADGNRLSHQGLGTSGTGGTTGNHTHFMFHSPRRGMT